MTRFLFKLRNRHFFFLDLIALSVIPTMAVVLRLDGFQGLSRYTPGLLIFTLVGLLVWASLFRILGLHNRYWRYASVDEILLIVIAVAIATALNALFFFALRLLLPALFHLLSYAPSTGPGQAPINFSLPRSTFLISGLLALVFVGGSRFSIRFAERWRRRSSSAGQRTLIIGAGDAGRLIVKELESNPQLRLEPVGFIDDDPAKHGMRIHGLSVLGGRERFSQLVRDYHVSQAIIAMPTASGKTIRHFVELCEEAGIQAKTIPGIYELLSGRVSVSQIRKVDIEDLLRREPVEIEADEVARMIRGKRVLVTGAGGSIGLEICRQALEHGAAELVLLGHGENSIFRALRELQGSKEIREKGKKGRREEVDKGIGEKGDKGIREQGSQGERGRGEEGNKGIREKGNKGERGIQSPISNTQYPIPNIYPVIADIRDRQRLQSIFEEYRPHIVFHAAAHKHLPLMECNVAEAVTNNVLGTKCLIEAAERAGVNSFVLISTDKAVNPTSIMGVTKRVAEKLIVAAHDRQLASLSNLQPSNLQPATRNKPATRFTAVRFGNVLGSRGSVVNIFREQIADGGPVTVTHPDMRRYFMTIPEAVQLVLQAAAIGQGGEVFVLDMGEPVPIVELARDLIRLSGLEVGRDIDIKYIGPRPGEKLFEELFADGEVYERTQHEKIFVCRNGIVEQGNNGTREKGEKEEGKWKMEGGKGRMEDGKGKGEGELAGLYADLEGQVDELISVAQRGDADEVRCLLREIVPEYRPNLEEG